jgi:bacterioferritin
MAMTRQQMIDALNEDLAFELSSIIQYLTYAAKVTGPYRPELSKFFAAEIPEETGHAQFLANKITALGGEPTTTPRPVAAARTNRQMLEAVLKAEADAVERYARRVRQADDLGDVGLRVQLENIAQDETGHREEVERILRDWAV